MVHRRTESGYCTCGARWPTCLAKKVDELWEDIPDDS